MSSLSPSPHPFLSQEFLTSQLLVISLFDYADVVYVPSLNLISTKSYKIIYIIIYIKRIQNSCLRFSYLCL